MLLNTIGINQNFMKTQEHTFQKEHQKKLKMGKNSLKFKINK